MKRKHWHTRWGLGAVVLLTALMPVQGSAADPGQSDGNGHEQPGRIDLPDGWQPEGITSDGKSLFVGSLADGAIFRADPWTGHGKVLAKGADGRVAVGIDYDERRDLLWVVGGPTGAIRAHDADTGKLLATYKFPTAKPRFLNDVVVTRRGVYATDSSNQELAVVPLDLRGDDLGDDDLPAASAAKTLPLTGDLTYVAGFNLNGIVEFDGALLSIQSNRGLLFRIDPCSGDTESVDLAGEKLTNGDGLEVDDELLYVVRNQDNLIAAVELDDDGEEGRLVDEVTNGHLDVPSTVAHVRHSLWAVNARFGTPPKPDTPYWVTRLDEVDD